jgi:hypothetical protein
MNSNQLLGAGEENHKKLNYKLLSRFEMSSKCKHELLVQISSSLENSNPILLNFKP